MCNKIGSNVVHDPLPNGKGQIHRCRLAEFIRLFGGLGDQIIRNYGLKNQLAILKSEIKENFNKLTK